MLDFTFGAHPDAGSVDAAAHVSVNCLQTLWPVGSRSGNWVEFLPVRRRMASSFCTTDLTQIDPTAMCRSDVDACMVRNAICKSAPDKPGSEASFHCVCRPGACAVGAGICVDQKCTMDVAKVEGALGAGNSKQQGQAVEQAQKLQKELDDAKDKSRNSEVVQWSSKEDTYCKKSGSVPLNDEGYGFGMTEDDCKAQCIGDPKCKMYTFGQWNKWGWYYGKMRCQMYSECDPGAQTSTALHEKVLDENKQPDVNEYFAGIHGIMPSVELKGMSSTAEATGDYKIKFVLPSDSSLKGGAGGKVQIGSDDFNPAIVDGLGRLAQKLEQAEKLQNSIGDGWGDQALPAKTAGGKRVGTSAKNGVAEDSMPGCALAAAWLSPDRTPGRSCRQVSALQVSSESPLRRPGRSQWASFL